MRYIFRLAVLVAGLVMLALRAPAWADRPPSWLVGTFRGFNEMYNLNVELRITDDGRIISIGTRDDGTMSRETGNYRNGLLYIGRSSYEARSRNNGFLLTETQDRQNRTDYRRIGGSGGWPGGGGGGGEWPGGGNPQSPPSWLVGVYQGYNRKYNLNIDLYINGNGRITSKGRQPNGGMTSQGGYYRNNRLYIGDSSYRYDRTRDGIRLTEERDRSNQTDYRRIGGNGGSGGSGGWPGGGGGGGDTRPPSWLVGTFTGYNQKNRLDMTLRIDALGRATATGRRPNGSQITQAGRYRNGNLILDNREYDIDRRGSGFRLTERRNRSNRTDYNRVVATPR
jgi:hypothetical protein